MPDIDGYGLARLVRADPRLARTPIVILTSSAQRGEAERAAEAGINTFVSKPIRSAQLRAALTGPNAADPRLEGEPGTFLVVEDTDHRSDRLGHGRRPGPVPRRRHG